MAYETKKMFFVEARTGCTCCSDNNSYHGPYLTEEIAKSTAQTMYNSKYICSQYSPNGDYSLLSQDCEELPDGRIIVGRYVIGEGEGGYLGESNGLFCMELRLEKSNHTNWFLE